MNKKKAAKTVWICAYVLIIIIYGIIGASLSAMLLPDFPFWILFFVSLAVGVKLDYSFKGLAYKFEQKYVSYMEK